MSPLTHIVAHQPKQSRKSLAASQSMAGGIIGLSLLGYFLDQYFETAPNLLLTGLATGLIVGFYDLWKAMFPPGDDR